jgi:hypothetical protein
MKLITTGKTGGYSLSELSVPNFLNKQNKIEK